ncbi:MAG: helix-turn-helix transcriptional regulator [Victivallales bacterium]|nr:helix-turn-helix transcriptional regulator [Victivallales bacterium]
MKKGIKVIYGYPRIFEDNAKVYNVAWLPKHIAVFKNSVIDHNYVCFSVTRKTGTAIRMVNGEARYRTRLRFPNFQIYGVSLAGTQFDSIRGVSHDELYFSYLPDDFTPPYPSERIFQITDTFNKCLEMLYHALEHIEEPGMADRVDLMAKMLQLEATYSADQTEKDNPIELKLYRIAGFIDLNYHEKINFDELSYKFGLGRRTFYRKWKEYFDETPTQCLLKIRIDAAKYYLCNSNMRAKEIASLCGFENALYFSQIFKRKTGASPQNFRYKTKH